MKRLSRLQRIAPGIGLSVLAIALTGAVALAGTNSTTLPNGADLSVSIDSPETSTEFLIDEGESSRDITVQGTASVGLGEADATLVYVMDVSGSTDIGGGTGCSPILVCEENFFVALNNAAVSDGSVDEVGLAVYADSAAAADMSPNAGNQFLVAPDEPGVAPFWVNTVINSAFSDSGGGNGGVTQFALRNVGQFTNCGAGLQQAVSVIAGSTNSTNTIIFASDGLCNTGPNVTSVVVPAGVVVHSVAIGSGSSCTTDGGQGTLNQVARNGGQCFAVADPGNLPDIIPSLIGSTLESLEISVDGGAAVAIDNADITPDLPQPGAVSVDYSMVVQDLAAGDHDICVTANGVDSAGNTGSVTQCETIHLYEFRLTPAAETNELGSDNSHTVTATLVGDHDLAGRTVSFSVAGPGTASPSSDDVTTDGSGVAMFTYTVPVEPGSLGTDTITASITLADPMGETATRTVEKEWVDTTPPEATCTETVNPHGNTTPPAGSTTLPGAKGGQNEDGFYLLDASDDVWPDSDLELFVTDDGSGTVFGPYPVDTVIKYTQDADAVPTAKNMGSTNGQAGAVTVHIIGNGDGILTAVDGSGNVSDGAACLVPEPPK